MALTEHVERSDKAEPGDGVEPLLDPRYVVYGPDVLHNIADMLEAVEKRDLDPGRGVGAWFEGPITVVTDGLRLGYLTRHDDFWHFVPDPKEQDTWT